MALKERVIVLSAPRHMSGIGKRSGKPYDFGLVEVIRAERDGSIVHEELSCETAVLPQLATVDAAIFDVETDFTKQFDGRYAKSVLSAALVSPADQYAMGLLVRQAVKA